MSYFKLVSKFKPTGDQPQAIEKLVANLNSGAKHQTLLGVTGSGKTFTIANVIEKIQKPTLVISHNKTLAAQLYQEFREFFPENSVHYFVSYYDYYQPEAYMPTTDTYIEKDAKINEVIDALRHASTASLLSRKDVIIVASVSCIYGLGSPEEYEKVSIELKIGDKVSQKDLLKKLVMLQYTRNPLDPRQGHFRTRENTVEIYLPSCEEIIFIEIYKGSRTSLGSPTSERIVSIKKSASNLSPKTYNLKAFKIFPAKHFVTPQVKLGLAVENILQELKDRLAELKKQGKILEAARLKQRTEYDLEMLASAGYVNGIENYSRHLDFREAGTAPFTLLDYFHHACGHKPPMGHSERSEESQGKPLEEYRDSSPAAQNDKRKGAQNNSFLTIIDESHASIPQIRGMYFSDKSRKDVLINYGFRLPSARDNRPLKFDEFNKKIGQTIYVSATPADYELSCSRLSLPQKSCGRLSLGHPNCVIEQLIRPTGILDPEIEIRPTKNQMKDVIYEVQKRVAKKERSLVLTLTKRLAEDIADYLAEEKIKAEYLHSEVKTFERTEILKKLRTGEYDVLVGINLLREGLDLPEVSFIAILDADKEGFLRNKTTLLQIIGRAARHTDGKVILYADQITGSIREACEETDRRRKIQWEYNKKNHITPQHIKKEIRKSLTEELKKDENELIMPSGPKKEALKELGREMRRVAKKMDFEMAAKIRDRIKDLQKTP